MTSIGSIRGTYVCRESIAIGLSHVVAEFLARWYAQHEYSPECSARQSPPNALFSTARRRRCASEASVSALKTTSEGISLRRISATYEAHMLHGCRIAHSQPGIVPLPIWALTKRVFNFLPLACCFFAPSGVLGAGATPSLFALKSQ